MVRKLVITLLLITFTSSCANQLTSNIIKDGESIIAGGVSSKAKWDESMLFKRVSWYKDFTLLFDSHMWKVPEGSPFLNWFSDREKSYMNKCADFYVLITYAMDTDLISDKDFLKQLELQGADFMELPEFKSNLKLHPHFLENSFSHYKVGGLCVKRSSTTLKVSFPGYNEKEL